MAENTDTLEILKQLAQQVRNATSEGENTAERVGRTLVGIIDHLGDGDSITEGMLDEKLEDYPTKQEVTIAMSRYVTTDFFARLFAPEGEDGAEVDVNDMEAVITAVRVKFGLHTDSYLSAKGNNPESGSTVAGASALVDLSDVDISNPQDGQILSWNGTKWVNADAPSAGLDEAALAEYLTTNHYAKTTDIPSLEGYATQTWASGQFALKTVAINAGTGLTGGGTLSASRTLSLATVGTAGTYTKVTVDSYGRVTGHASLTQGDIPALAISKITGLQTALDAKLNKSVFEELFEKVWVSGYGYAIRAKLAFYSDDWISAKGLNSDAGSTTGGVDKDEVLQIVEGAGYIKSSALSGYATQSWVNSKNYLTQGTADGRYFRKSISTISDTTTDADDLYECGIYINATGNSGTNSSFPSGYGLLLNFAYDGSKRFQLHAQAESLMYQSRFDGSTTSDWIELLSAENYTNYTVTKTGGGASGTWGIGISGNAATASRWQTARVLTLTGDVTGSTTWDGSGNASCPVTVNHAAEAAKLQTARTLWGKSFNGTANVDGDMTGVGNIIPSVDNRYYCGRWDRRWNFLYSMNYNIGSHGSNYLGDGNGDSASFSTYNVKLHLHYGLGITSNMDVCNIVIDGRTGNISTRGSVQIGSAKLIYDSANNALYVQNADGTACGFYATGFLSAKGLNSDAGSAVVGATTLNGLTDVTISSPVNGQSLVYRNGVWKNEMVSGGGSASVNWDDINGKPTWIPDTDGSGSGIDADLLDGTHKSGLFTAMTYAGSTLSLTIGGVKKSVNIETSAVIPTVTVSSSSSRNLSVNVGGSTDYVNDLYATYLDGTTKAGLFTGLTYSSNRLSVTIGGTTKSVTINAGSSGSYLPLSGGTISGDLKVNGQATFNTQSVHNYGILTSNIYTNQSMYIRYGSADTARIYCNWASGMIISVDGANTEFTNTYIATGTSTASAFDLGISNRRWRTIYSVNSLNTSSDLRLKDVRAAIPLTVAQVAAAPSFLYRWKKGADTALHAGSSAQYWRQALPQAVTEGADGYLAMEYDRIALAAAIATARAVETLDQRVTRLEKENGKLKKRIKELERRAA